MKLSSANSFVHSTTISGRTDLSGTQKTGNPSALFQSAILEYKLRITVGADEQNQMLVEGLIRLLKLYSKILGDITAFVAVP